MNLSSPRIKQTLGDLSKFLARQIEWQVKGKLQFADWNQDHVPFTFLQWWEAVDMMPGATILLKEKFARDLRTKIVA